METRSQASDVGLDVDRGGLTLLGEVDGSGNVLLVGAENTNSLDSHDVRWICGWGNGVMDEKRKKKKKRREELQREKIVTKRQTKERRHFQDVIIAQQRAQTCCTICIALRLCYCTTSLPPPAVHACE